MVKKYYIKRSGRISGPFSGSEVKSGVKTRRLLEQDLVSLSKDGPWRTLQGVFEKVRAAEARTELRVCEVCGNQTDSKDKTCDHCGDQSSS